MPPPRVLKITRTIAVHDEEDKQLVSLQNQIENISAKNRQWLIAEGNRQSEKQRRIMAKKIKEAQLRQAATKFEAKKLRDTQMAKTKEKRSGSFGSDSTSKDVKNNKKECYVSINDKNNPSNAKEALHYQHSDSSSHTQTSSLSSSTRPLLLQRGRVGVNYKE